MIKNKDLKVCVKKMCSDFSFAYFSTNEDEEEKNELFILLCYKAHFLYKISVDINHFKYEKDFSYLSYS